jgi:cytochrome c
MKTYAFLAALLVVPATASAEGTAEAGAVVFRKCTACHSAEESTNKVGPHLVGIVGRPAASLADYTKYSEAMKQVGTEGLIWDETTLVTYLAAPKKMIPKSRMAFSGLKEEQDIADVIAYLKAVGAR